MKRCHWRSLPGRRLGEVEQCPPEVRGVADKMLMFEPGRSIIGNAGILVTRVEYLKRTEVKNYAIVDAAMNDLLRPTLYDAWMGLVPVQPRFGAAEHYDATAHWRFCRATCLR